MRAISVKFKIDGFVRLLPVLICLFWFNIESQAQQVDDECYYSFYNKYLMCKLDSDETSAYINLKSALKLNAPFNIHLNEMIKLELQKGKLKSALNYAKKATLQGYQYYNNRFTTDDANGYEFKDSTFLKVPLNGEKNLNAKERLFTIR